MPRFARPAALAALVVATAAVAPAAQAGELELSFYAGIQEAPHSRVRGNDGEDSFNFLAEWEGKSTAMPPYYGIRATWWNGQLGYGVEFTHSKIYATDETLEDNGFDTLEMTDGLNHVTVNAMYRWPGLWATGRLTPYVGGGVGFTVPHVEVTRGDSETYGYQYAGPAAAVIGGLSWAFNEDWAVFGEYKGSYAWLDTELDNGGSIQSDIITNAFNIGISYTF